MNERRSKLADTDAGSKTEPEDHKTGKAIAGRGSAQRKKNVEGRKAAARKAGKAEDKSSEPEERKVVDKEAEQTKQAEQAEEVENAKAVDEEIEALDERKEDPEDPEEIDRLKRKYMVLRFWQTARRFWTDPRSLTAWLLTVGLFVVILLNLAAAYAMNVWNRNIFDALEKKDAGAVVTLSGVYIVDPGRQRAVRRRPGLRAHDAAAALAQMADRQPGRSLAEVRPLLPAQPGQRRSQKPGIPHRRRRADRDRIAGRFRQRRHVGLSVGCDLHRRAVDHRRLAQSQHRSASTSTSRASWWSPPCSTR